MSRLRKQLEPHEVLLTRAPGYVVTVESAELDLLRFRELRDGGRLELDAGRDEDAADTYRAALDLMRVAGRGTSKTILSVKGGVVDRVVRPSPKLVAPGQ